MTSEQCPRMAPLEDAIPLRRAAAFVGLPLSLALVLPWYSGSESVSAWAFSERVHRGFVVMPALGLLLLSAAFAPRLSVTVRRAMVVTGGLGALGCAVWLLRDPSVLRLLGELRSMSVVGVTGLGAAWILAGAAEIAMHEQPRARAVAAWSACAWLALLAAMALPLGPRVDLEESWLGGVVALASDGDVEPLIGSIVMAMPICLAITGLVLALRRSGRDRDRAATRRFRTRWMAYVLVPLPIVAVFLLGAIAALADDAKMLPNMVNGLGLGLGATFGGALAIGHLPALLATVRLGERDKRVGLVGAGLVAFLLVARAVWPDARDGRIAALALQMSEATIGALRGEPVDPRFLGGYEEFDLRAARSRTSGHFREGADLQAKLYAMQVRAITDEGAFDAWVAVLPDGRVRWVARDAEWTEVVELDVLEQAGVADLVVRLADAGERCLPSFDDAELAALPASLQQRFVRGRLCGSGGSSSEDDELRTFGALARGILGTVDRYVLWLDAGGEDVLIEGPLRTTSGRLWIGEPTVQ